MLSSQLFEVGQLSEGYVFQKSSMFTGLKIKKS